MRPRIGAALRLLVSDRQLKPAGMVWLTAVVLIVLAGSAAKELARATVAAVPVMIAEPRDQGSLARTPVAEHELVRLAELVRASRPGVRIAIEGTGDSRVVAVSAERLETMESWRSAIGDVLLSIPGAEWAVVQLCAGRDCAQVPLSATFSVVRVQTPTS